MDQDSTALPDAAISRILASLDTRTFARPDAAPTRVLVALNPGNDAFTGVAVFRAAYPVRVPPGLRPVTVWDTAGSVVPSRIVDSALTQSADLPPGRRLWSFRLEVLVATAIPAGSAAGWAAGYGESLESAAPDGVWTAALEGALPLRLYETDIHSGVVRLPCALSALPVDIMGTTSHDRPA
jgi:hypothetical protein